MSLLILNLLPNYGYRSINESSDTVVFVDSSMAADGALVSSPFTSKDVRIIIITIIYI